MKVILHRKLDTIEEQFINHSVAMHVVEYEGIVNELALKRAFDALCTRYPVLRGEVVRKGGGYEFQVTGDSAAKMTTIHGGIEGLLSQESKISKLAAIQGEIPTLAQLVFAPTGVGGYLMLAIHHILTGGGSGLYYFGYLWSLYTEAINKKDSLDVPAGVLPRSPSELLTRRWCAPGNTTSSSPAPRSIAERTVDTVIRTIRLDRKRTAQLVEKARSFRLTVNSLLIGQTAANLEAQNASESGLVNVACQVRFFKRMSPPIEMTETTNCLGWIFLPLHVANANPVEIAREFVTLKEEKIKNRSVIIANHTHSQEYVQSLIASSDIYWNAGGNRIPKWPSPTNVRIGKWFHLGLKAEELGRSEMPIPKRWKIFAFCSTFNDELVVRLQTGRNCSSVMDEIESAITSLLK